MPVGKTRAGVWYFKVYVPTGRFDPDGKPIKKQVLKKSKKWNKRQAEKAERAFLATIETDPTQLNSITFDTLFDEFYSYKKPRVKASTLKELESVYRVHLRDYFGGLKVNTINRRKVELFQNEIYKRKTKNGTLFKNNTLRKIQQHLFSLLRYAANHDYMRSLGSIEYVRREEIVSKENYFTESQFQKFIALVDDLEERAFFCMLYFTGMRLGEITGLLISSVDLDAGTVKVTHQFSSRERDLDTTKTKNSLRTIFLPEVLLSELRPYVADAFTRDHDRSDFFFLRFRSPSTITRRKDRICELAGIPRITLHGFRHSHVSFLVNHGFSVHEIADRISDTPDMVYKVYGHLFASSKVKMAAKIDAAWERLQQRLQFLSVFLFHFNNCM